MPDSTESNGLINALHEHLQNHGVNISAYAGVWIVTDLYGNEKARFENIGDALTYCFQKNDCPACWGYIGAILTRYVKFAPIQEDAENAH